MRKMAGSPVFHGDGGPHAGRQVAGRHLRERELRVHARHEGAVGHGDVRAAVGAPHGARAAGAEDGCAMARA